MDYVGQCSICDNILEESGAGYCIPCGLPFCWGTHGGWVDGEHVCDNCSNEEAMMDRKSNQYLDIVEVCARLAETTIKGPYAAHIVETIGRLIGSRIRREIGGYGVRRDVAPTDTDSVVVPIQPTAAMLLAGSHAAKKHWGDEEDSIYAACVYEAMINQHLTDKG